MLNRRFLLLGVMVTTVFCATLVISEQSATSREKKELCIPLGNLLLKAPASVDMKLKPVDFPHGVHFDVSCKQCHHKWDGNSNVKTCMASGCHDVAVAPKKPLKHGTYTLEAKKYYKYAYHEKCRECHKGIKEDNEKLFEMDDVKATGPTGCSECHPK